jgi:battenin
MSEINDNKNEGMINSGSDTDQRRKTKTTELKEKVFDKSMRIKGFILFFLLGTINNLTYCVIISFSNDISKEFHKESLMSFFSSSLVFFGMLVKVLNSRYLIKIKHKYKIWSVIIIWVLSLGLLILGKYAKLFGLTIIASILVGLGTGLGDITNIGFMKCFPPIILSGYSSGTGMSGVTGATLYLVFKLCDVSFNKTVLSMLVFYPIYALCFFLVIRMKLQMQNKTQELLNEMDSESQLDLFENSQNDIQELISGSQDIVLDHQENLEDVESKINKKLTWENVKIVFKKAWGLYLIFGLLYFFEYFSITGICSQITKLYQNEYKTDKMPTIINVLFEVLQLAYQVGIFTTRSSLDLVRIKKIWIIMFALGTFTLGLFLQTILHGGVGIWLPILVTYFVGFSGGLGYANIYHQVLEHPKILKNERELSVNINGTFADLGVIVSSLVGYFFSFLWKGIN